MPSNMPDVVQDDDHSTYGDVDLRKEITSRYDRCESYYSDWKELAEEDYNFALGDQWTEEEKAKLEVQKRPCLTFNRIRSLINVVSGYQRENSARIKVTPEGGEDRVFSEVWDKVLRYQDKCSKLSYKFGYLFDDGCYCGKGHIEGFIDYIKDPIRGELKFKLNGPYKVYVDPDCNEYDINEGAEYLFKVEKFSKAKLKSMYPDKKKVIDEFKTDNDAYLENADVQKEGDSDNYGNNPNSATVTETYDNETDSNQIERDIKFTHKEYWYKKYVIRYFVIDRDSGEPVKFETMEQAEEFVNQAKEQFPDLYRNEVRIIDHEVYEIWVAAYVCGHILQDVKSPFEPQYNGFPHFRYIADWAPSADKETLKVQGITRPLKDPQKEKNKSKSQFLHVLSTQSNSGWIGDEDALSDAGWQDLKNMGSTPGLTVRKKPGSDLREIEPKAPAMAQILREQGADEEMKQISNINPDLLGMQERTTSGKAIALRVRQAVLSLVRLFVNYRYTKEIVGNFMLAVIPIMYDEKKIGKVLGQKYRASVKSDQFPEGLTDGVLKGFLQMIKDRKYDVEVTEADHTATVRAEVFDNLIELAKTPAGQFIPLDLILEYMEIPNKDEIEQKVNEAKAQQMAMAQQAKK